MRRALALVALAFLLAATDARAAQLESHWSIPYPFASPQSQWIGTQGTNVVRGPRASIDAGVGAGSLYRLRRFRWSGWGTGRAVGRGRAIYCSDSCEGGWRRVSVVLTGRRDVVCGDAVEHREYTRYRLRGFTFVETATFQAAPSVC